MQEVKKGPKNGAEWGWSRVAFLVIAWLLILSLARDVWKIRGGFGRITEANLRLEAEQKKNTELSKKLEAVQTTEYQEKLIRERLSMQREGEVLVVMPEPKIENSAIDQTKSGFKEVSNWEKWWNLLRG